MEAPTTSARWIVEVLLETLHSRTSRSFRRRYARLPPDVQEFVRRTYHSWIANPFSPAYGFKKLDIAPGYWSVDVGYRYRALAQRVSSDSFVFYWVGTHEDYNKEYKNLKAHKFVDLA